MPPAIRNPIYVNETMQQIMGALANFFEPEQKRHKAATEELVHKNFLLGGNPNGFFYKTKLYASLKPFQLRQENITTLHPTLEPEAENLHNLISKLDKDWQKLRQYLSVLINQCDTKMCQRNRLPEPIVQLIPEFRSFKRTGEPPIHLQSKYAAACEILDYYLANQVVYT